MAIAVTVVPAKPARRLAAPSSCSMNSSALRRASADTPASAGASAGLVSTLTLFPRTTARRSVHLHALLDEVFYRARMERHARLGHALVLQLQLVRLAVDRDPISLLVERRLDDVVGELVGHLGVDHHDVPHRRHLVVLVLARIGAGLDHVRRI